MHRWKEKGLFGNYHFLFVWKLLFSTWNLFLSLSGVNALYSRSVKGTLKLPAVFFKYGNFSLLENRYRKNIRSRSFMSPTKKNYFRELFDSSAKVSDFNPKRLIITCGTLMLLLLPLKPSLRDKQTSISMQARRYYPF